MKLYYHPLSTYSQKALIALHEKNVSFEREVVSLMQPESRAAYEKIYPIGKVPLLVLADGHMLPESTIIIEYLEGHVSGTRLIPDGIDESRKVRFHDRMSDLYLNNPATTLLFNQLKFEEYLPATVDRARKTLETSLGLLEHTLGDRQWVAGDAFSMADCATIPALFYLNVVRPFADLPNLSRYWQQAQQRASYRQVMEEFVPVWESMRG